MREAKRLANYDDMRFANDFKLLLGTWVFDLNYPHSRKLLRERGLMESLLATWPDDERLLHAREAVLSALYAEL